jgi:phosphoribosylaminoimidazole carboxylase
LPEREVWLENSLLIISGAAHLPGMVAALTPLPVIGVPVKATHLDGMDSLLSIVQMPVSQFVFLINGQRGIPVASVAINNSTNAALLALRIIGTRENQIQTAMAKYLNSLKEEVNAKIDKLENVGWREYLAHK